MDRVGLASGDGDVRSAGSVAGSGRRCSAARHEDPAVVLEAGTPLGTDLTGPARGAAGAPAGAVELLGQRDPLPGHQHAPGATAAGPAPRVGQARHGGCRPPATPRGRVGSRAIISERACSVAICRPFRSPRRGRPCRKRFLPMRSASSAQMRASGSSNSSRETRRPTRCPAAGRRQRQRGQHGGQGVEDVEAGHVGRLADGGQVDGLGPGEQGSARRRRSRIDSPAPRSGRARRARRPACVVRRRRRRGPGATSGWSPSGGPGHLRVVVRSPIREPLPGIERFAERQSIWRSRAIRSVPVRVLPGTPRGRLVPQAHMLGRDRRWGSARQGVGTVCPTIRRVPPVRCG